MTERGQSEVVGFLLVFALALATMTLITVAGVDGLRDVRDAERVNNADRAFDVLAENVDDLVEQGVSSQATEVSLADARLAFGDPITVTVSGEQASDPDEEFSYAFAVRPIVYESGDGERIVSAGGATFRGGRSGTVMREGPPFLLSPERSNVLVVQTRQVGQPSAVAGSSTVLVRTELAESDLYRLNATTYDLTVEVDSPRAAAWGRYLEDQPGTSCGAPSGGSVSCSLTTDHVSVTVARVNVLFE